MDEPERRRWRQCRPEDAAGWLAGLAVPWWVAGGWAVELHCGAPTRPHGDLDVGCFRDDLDAVRARLPGWVVCAARDGRLSRLDIDAAPARDVHSLWCRPDGADEWWLEVMLDERDGDDWVYRRSSEIRLLASELCLRSDGGIPYLRPEVQLLYKARHARARDQADFEATLPRLDASAVRWLRDALSRCEPEHAWLHVLSTAGSGEA